MKNFFSEDINVYSNNTLKLFKYFNDDNFIKNNFNELKNNKNFLEFVLPNKFFLNEIFKKDHLYIYKIIDFYYSNYDICNLKKKNIYELLNKKNYNTIEYIWNNLNSLNIDFNNDKLSEEIFSNPDDYFFFLFNQLWLKRNDKRNIDNSNLQILGEQLLICYYYNLFYHNKNFFLKTKDSNYENFFRIINIYDSYTIDYENKTISFKSIEKNNNTCNNLLEKIKIFFSFSLENKIVNKNMLIWYYIFFKEYLSKQLQNDFLHIVFNSNENIIGFINKLFKNLEKEFYEYTEEDIEEIFNNFKDEKYIYKVQDEDVEFLSNVDMFEITNNLFLLNSLKKKNKSYSLINIDDIDKLNIENFYFIFLISPLKNSFKNVVKKIKDITKKNIINFSKTNDNPYYIYNSSILKNFNKFNYFFDNDKVFSSDLRNFQEIENYFNMEILFYKLIKYLNNYEIIPKTNINLKNNIDYYKFDLDKIIYQYISLYPSQEKILDGYQKS